MKTALPTKVKLAYGVGDFGTNLVLQFISFGYLFYLIVVFQIDPAVAGVVIGVSKLWDAVIDPLIGSLIERTRSRFGKNRPFLLFGALPLAISLALLFATPDLSTDLKVVWAFATYILFSTAMSFVNIPYAALTVAIAKEPKARTVLSSWRMTFALAGTLIAGGISPLLLGAFGDPVSGHRAVAVLFGLIFVAVILTSFFGVRETQAGANKPQISLREQFRAVFSNGPFLILAGGTFFILTAVAILPGVVKFFFIYNLASPGSEALGLGALFVSAILYLPLLTWVSNRRGKQFAFLLALTVFVLVLVVIFLIGQTNLPLLIGCFVVAGIGIAAVFLMPWSMVADTVAYTEAKTGVLVEGVFYGYFLFVIKAAQSFGGFIQGIVLKLAGFQNSELTAQGYSQNLPQTPEALQGIALLLSLIPAALVVLGILVLTRYRLPTSAESGASQARE